MKGLILKDVYGCRFQIIGGFALMIFPMMIMALSGGAMFGVGESEGMKTISVVMYGMLNYISIVVSSSFFLNTLTYDEASGWTKMQRAMPLTGRQIICGKFLAAGAVIGLLTAVSLAFNAVSAALYGMPFEPMIAMPLCVGLAELVTMLPVIVLGYRFGAKSVTWIYFAILIAVALGSIVLIMAFFMGDITENALRAVAYAGIPALTAAVTAVCCATGKKAVMVDI